MGDSSGIEGNQQLEQFTLLAKSLKGRAVVGLIQSALGAKRVFVFGELLAMPNVQALKESEHVNYVKLLEIFCYGKYSDYQQTKKEIQDFPELNEAQLKKLRLLSIVSACRERRQITYENLAQELETNTTRELEDYIIEAIYSGLVFGKMDQKQRIFYISRTASRDLPLQDIPRLAARLQQWAETAKVIAQALAKQRQQSIESRALQTDRTNTLNAAVEDISKHIKDDPEKDRFDSDFGINDGGGSERVSKRRAKRSRFPLNLK
uniref:PCI domain-containing protein n=1 Tax=Aureoumbra lagunensis TaxID=44058 RepID=A0A7S3NJ03_9STRA